MTRLLTSAAATALLGTAALADDDDLGAYLYAADCGSLSGDAIVADVGDLDRDDDASDEWARVSDAGAPQPDPLWSEDEDIDDVSADEIGGGGYAVAIHATDDEDADVVACGVLRGTLPFVAALDEVGGSGIEGRVAVGMDDDDELSLATTAFEVGAAD
ncbi:hypothetical protein BCF33_1574 [Hasllibacter halocynthiae]|uniref:Uncharacterized protein n=1 Tax=Hasllibacter halocynthiae TaxID=595589 RepID=A0A2T0X1A8_9RHOB|nr:hypothetical protein [Hasllibacter halocynthiae]PRY92720.1 hypothetical protein BCF33_1574 [Hasllibacter halocynthiae]